LHNAPCPGAPCRNDSYQKTQRFAALAVHPERASTSATQQPREFWRRWPECLTLVLNRAFENVVKKRDLVIPLVFQETVFNLTQSYSKRTIEYFGWLGIAKARIQSKNSSGHHHRCCNDRHSLQIET
jgi:hypothetical protein